MQTPTFEGRIFEPRNVVGWLLFTASAGFVNGGAVMACNGVATHITGNVTSFAVDSGVASAFVVVVALFLGGSMLAVLISESLRKNARLAFAAPILLAVAILVAVAIAGKAGAFGTFGAFTEGGDVTRRGFVLLGCLSASMGVVNAAVGIATNNQIRVTHLTGPATDLAVNIVRGTLDTGRGSAVELRWAMLRFAKLSTFAIGAAISAKVAGRLCYDVFAVSAVVLIGALGFASAIGQNTTAPEPTPKADAKDDPPASSKDDPRHAE